MSDKEIPWQGRRHKRYRFYPWVEKIPGREWQPTPVSRGVFLTGPNHISVRGNFFTSELRTLQYIINWISTKKIIDILSIIKKKLKTKIKQIELKWHCRRSRHLNEIENWWEREKSKSDNRELEGIEKTLQTSPHYGGGWDRPSVRKKAVATQISNICRLSSFLSSKPMRKHGKTWQYRSKKNGVNMQVFWKI